MTTQLTGLNCEWQRRIALGGMRQFQFEAEVSEAVSSFRWDKKWCSAVFMLH